MNDPMNAPWSAVTFKNLYFPVIIPIMVWVPVPTPMMPLLVPIIVPKLVPLPVGMAVSRVGGEPAAPAPQPENVIDVVPESVETTPAPGPEPVRGS